MPCNMMSELTKLFASYEVARGSKIKNTKIISLVEEKNHFNVTKLAYLMQDFLSSVRLKSSDTSKHSEMPVIHSPQGCRKK